ncbi:osmotically inducible protein OsmC [Flavipsychrobacter stenotrophus]|uniref:Osmotically inducible protein OsmC n=1 Tax=Flavipsychrobacter stenotrophus TaxID=2077091 RepID=A0A2S7SZP0_9BACT|nr:OsmC family protein [Flavipsychrobacter stenotrophus]PQJ12419.1 osmotically inducible protein OsmC [Flavipsychrobacter stenotrophus]
MTSKVTYTGDLRTTCTHLRSGSTIETDAPVDNHGKGERFSPTDLLATALASCMVTTMGIACLTHNINIDGMECDVEKIMVANPRKVGEVKIDMRFPQSKPFTDKEKKILETAAINCPIMESLHPDCKKTLNITWPA